MTVDSTMLRSLEWRCIGPHRGGRATAVVGHPTNPMLFYFGACNGGVWKTEDGGTYWENVSDGFFATASVGAIAVADSDPNVIYVGMGEACIRNDVSSGDGVYKSTDGGQTWKRLGLAQTRHIGKIQVHPQDPDLVYVAALGHAWGPNEERGVFRSNDGGGTWDKILFRSAKAGAIDLSMDPNNPRSLYAAIWEVYRTPWTISSGGPDSSLYRSTDGGDTWVELNGNPGLPTDLMGRIGVAVSPAQSNRVWAMVEAKQGGLFRSEDGGEAWELVNDTTGRGRPWYHTHIVADPCDPETVWVMDVLLHRSTDGGHTFFPVPAPHADYHDLWIDPRNPQRMISANDGGAMITFNGSRSWSSIYNQPTAPFYHLAVDNRYPYRVYGTQQDNSAVSVPSKNEKGFIHPGDCYATGLSESGHIAVRPDNSDIVYSGCIGMLPPGIGDLHRADHATANHAELRTVWPEDFYGWAPKDQKYRFQWTYPIVISPHDPNLLYVAGNHVFRSFNEGKSWEVISPDLTRNDPSKLGIQGGPITVQGVTGADNYCTVFAFAESPHKPGVLWAGSDDGLIHLSQDEGKSWDEVTPSDLPEWTTIANIELSPHDPAAAYVAAYRYKLDDYRPFLYRTNDYGKTWQKITRGIPDDDFTRVIRADPVRRGLLYAGTETGLYLSFDDGESWQRFPGNWESLPGRNLPVVPIYDLTVKNDDLVVATHGRSFWILDDITPLREMSDHAAEASVHLFKPRPTYQDAGTPALYLRTILGPLPAPPGWVDYPLAGVVGAGSYENRRPDGSTYRVHIDAGDNPPRGVLVSYLLKNKPEGEVTLTFLDARGGQITSFTSGNEQAGENEKVSTSLSAQQVPAQPGMNRFVWDTRYPAAIPLPGDPAPNWPVPNQGPEAPPGTYQVRLTVDGQDSTETFEIVMDPRVVASQEEFEERFDLLARIRDKLSETHEAILRLRAVRQQAEVWERRAEGQADVTEAAQRLHQKLSAIEGELVQTKVQGALDITKYPVKLSVKIRGLAGAVASVLGAPTQQSWDVFENLSGRINEQLKRLEDLMRIDVAAFNDLVRQADLPPIISGAETTPDEQ